MNRYGKFYSEYYDLIYNFKNYKLETKFLINLIKKYYPKKNISVLELGSGTGGHAIIFDKKNYLIEGIEKSKLMIKNFRNKNKKIKIYNKDMRSFDLKKKYDVVVALFCVVNYLTSLKDFEKMVSSVNKHINKNSIIIFDFWYSPAVNYLKPKKTIFTYEKKNLSIYRTSKPIIKKNKKIDVLYNFQIKDNYKKIFFTEKHSVRHFNMKELKKIFNKFNLSLVYQGELITGKKPSKKTWKICCIFKKLDND